MKIERYLLEKWYDNKSFEFDLSESGINRLPICATNVLDSIRFFPKEILSEYGDSRGMSSFIAALSREYSCSNNNVIVTNGSSEGIRLILDALLEPNSEVVLFTPYYNNIEALIRSKGCIVREISIVPHNEFKFSVTDLSKNISSQTRLVLINTAHNPTGVYFSDEMILELNALAQLNGFYIICDDVASEIVYDDLLTVKPYRKILSNCIYINSFSKSYGLPGLRLGWIVAPITVIDSIRIHKEYTSVFTSPLLQVVGNEILSNKDSMLSENMRLLNSNLQYLINDIIPQSDRLELLSPQSGCCCLVQYIDSRDSFTLCKDILHHEGVLLVPGDIFHYDHTFRLGFGVLPNQFIEASNRLLHYFNSLER